MESSVIDMKLKLKTENWIWSIRPLSKLGFYLQILDFTLIRVGGSKFQMWLFLFL